MAVEHFDGVQNIRVVESFDAEAVTLPRFWDLSCECGLAECGDVEDEFGDVEFLAFGELICAVHF